MEHIVGEAAATLPYTVAVSVSSRILTFILNSVLLRLVSHDVLGLANVRLQLLYSTISFIAREPFRRALPAGETYHIHERKILNNRSLAVVNTNWLCPLIAAAVGLPLTAVWTFLLEKPPDEFDKTYNMAAILYATAAFIETLGEPANAAAHLAANFRLRMKVEGVVVGFQTGLTVVFVWLWSNHADLFKTWPGCELYGFALAQLFASLIYSASLWICMLSLVRHSASHHHYLYPTFFEPGYLKLSASFFAHSVVKQLLTEGERYVMTATGILTFAQQGVYNVVNNLGSLVARFVFLPLEETAYLIFSQMLDRKHKSTFSDLSSKSLVMLTRTLSATLKTAILVGVACAVFGWFYSDIALAAYAGQSFVRNTEAVSLLQLFCVYTVFLAVNGITESFTMAGMSQMQLHLLSFLNIVISVLYAGVTVFLARRLGSFGFIFANCLNMFCRILVAVNWITKFYAKSNFTPLRSSLPSFRVFACMALVSLVAPLLNQFFEHYRIVCGGTLGFISLAVVFFAERPHIRYMYNLVVCKRISGPETNEKDDDC